MPKRPESSEGREASQGGKTGPRVDPEASFKALEKAREELEAKKAAELGKAQETPRPS